MQKSQSVVKFFNKDAKKWFSRSDFRNNSKFDTIKERNIYVENYCKSVKPKFHLDIGCGTGNYTSEFQKKGFLYFYLNPRKITYLYRQLKQICAL